MEEIFKNNLISTLGNIILSLAPTTYIVKNIWEYTFNQKEHNSKNLAINLTIMAISSLIASYGLNFVYMKYIDYSYIVDNTSIGSGLMIGFVFGMCWHKLSYNNHNR